VVQLRPWFDQPIDRGPPVLLEQIRVFDGERPVRQGIRFRHDQNFIAFDFIGLVFGNPEGVMYEYRIRDIDHLVLRILDSLLHQVKSLMPGPSSSDLHGTSELPAVSCIMWLESKPFAIMEHPFVTSAAQVVQIVSWLLVRIFLGKHVANQTRSAQDLERLAVHALSTRSLVTSTHNRILELLANPDLLPSCTPISCTPISLSQALGTIGRLVVGILSRILGQPTDENSLTESFVAATVRIVSQAACIRVVEPRIDDEQLVTLVLTLNQPDLRSLHLDVMALPKTSTVDFRGMGAALLHAVRMFQEFEDSAGTDPVAFFRRCFIERKTSV
jgi:hypothetical protein